MIKRVIDISNPSKLSVQHSQLCIQQQGKIMAHIPIEDIGVLLLSHYAISLSTKVIVQCQHHKAIVVLCDDKMLPCSVFLPLFTANQLHHKVLYTQMAATQPRQKQLWKQVVQHKIKQQIVTLTLLHQPTAYLQRLSTKVLSGDSTNTEAQAAQYYWKHLLETPLIRNPNAGGSNALFNYGYAIIRSIIARAICCAGLHPTIGIFHRNQSNTLCLADDLMEPLRPWVDYAIAVYIRKTGCLTVDTRFKSHILKLPSITTYYKQKSMPLMVALHYLMADFKQGLEEPTTLHYPIWDRKNVTEWSMAG